MKKYVSPEMNFEEIASSDTILLESEISKLEMVISNNSSDFSVLEKSCIQLENKKTELDSLTEEWLLLCEE